MVVKNTIKKVKYAKFFIFIFQKKKKARQKQAETFKETGTMSDPY